MQPWWLCLNSTWGSYVLQSSHSRLWSFVLQQRTLPLSHRYCFQELSSYFFPYVSCGRQAVTYSPHSQHKQQRQMSILKKNMQLKEKNNDFCFIWIFIYYLKGSASWLCSVCVGFLFEGQKLCLGLCCSTQKYHERRARNEAVIDHYPLATANVLLDFCTLPSLY